MHDLELTEEQVMIRDMARDFARGEIAPHAQAWEKAGWIDDAQLEALAKPLSKNGYGQYLLGLAERGFVP